MAVTLTIPADTSSIRLARLVASGFASQLGATVADLDDLRTMVDELCSMLVAQSERGRRDHRPARQRRRPSCTPAPPPRRAGSGSPTSCPKGSCGSWPTTTRPSADDGTVELVVRKTSRCRPSSSPRRDAHQGAERELEAFRAYRDDPTLERRNALVAEHLGLARSLARRFSGRGEPLDDLEQVAFEGLVKAVERFDVDRGTSFAAFAVPTIVGEIKRHFRDHTWATKVPRAAKELPDRITAATEALSNQLHRAPTVSELADALGVGDDVVLEALDARAAYRPSSLSTPTDRDGGRTLGDSLANDDRGFARVEARLTVEDLLLVVAGAGASHPRAALLRGAQPGSDRGLASASRRCTSRACCGG